MPINKRPKIKFIYLMINLKTGKNNWTELQLKGVS